MAVPSDADNFERLLAALPSVSAAFTAPEVQLKAIEALSTALGGSPAGASVLVDAHAHTPMDVDTPAPSKEAAAAGPVEKAPAKKVTSSKPASSKKDWTITKGLNFAPPGQISLKDFAGEKSPRNQHERNVAACYYLAKIMEHSPVTVGDVLAVYQALNWPKPANPTNALQVTASTKGWLDTKDMSAITVVWAGTSYVEDEMPFKKAKA